RDEKIMSGWRELLAGEEGNRNEQETVEAGIAEWQKQYTSNAGARMRVARLANVKAVKAESGN
ncbi:hypothetical protein C5B26_13070, partial [Neisseria gonorrhoeae]|uniref:hypothetical protein n=1 Tax=Neisseria gonorrhoeae TaxID=485 RepID=UPI000D4B4D8E